MSGEDVLSQQEINALLNAVKSGGVSDESGNTQNNLRRYDLTSNDRIIRGRMPTLDIMSERMARLLRVSFFNFLRRHVEVIQEQMQLMKFNDFISAVSVPACLNVFRMPPLRNMCIVSVDSSLMFGIVDHLFGGSGSWFKVEGREYSSIELQVITKVVFLILEDLKRAWAPLVEINPEFVRTELNPQFANIATPTDVVINISFNVELDNATKGTITLLIPYSVIEPIRQLLTSSIQTEQEQIDDTWRNSIQDLILSVEVEFRALLGQGQVTTKQLLNLKVGDVVPLDTVADRPLTFRIQEIEKAWGRAVTSRGRLSVELAGPISSRASRSGKTSNGGRGYHERTTEQ